MSALRLTPHDERRAAVAAGVDPRTVRAYLLGREMRSTTHGRVEQALRELGIEQPQREQRGEHER